LLAMPVLLVAEGQSRDLPELLSKVLTAYPRFHKINNLGCCWLLTVLARACHDTVAMTVLAPQH